MLALLRRYRELILVSVLLVVPLGVFFAHVKRPTERSRLDRAVLWLTTPVERVVGWTITGALSGWRGYVALRHAEQRSREMLQEVNRLRLENQQLIADRGEVERLRRLLGFAVGAPQRTYLGAHVIGVKLGPTGLQLLTVDRGAGDGVDRMMPVVVAEGVVGRVQAVTGATADVLVLTDRNSSIAVRVERTRARANVRGLGKPDAARLDYGLRSEDMIEGDLLVTSGTDGVYPRGLPVGRVSELKRAAHGLFVEARVTPAVDVTRIEEVLVVTAWDRPAEDAPAALAPGKGPVKALAHVVVALVLAALQAVLLRWVGGGSFSLALLAACVVYLGLHEGNVDGSVAAAGTGYVLDLVTGSPKGLHTFLCVLLFVLVRGVAAAVDVNGRASFALLSGMGALVLSVGGLLLTRYTSPPELAPGALLLPRMLLEAFATALAAPLVLALLRRVDGLFQREEQGLLR